MSYKIRYTVEPGVFEKADAKGDFQGLTHQILLCSYIEDESGAGSYLWLSSNGSFGKDMVWGRAMHCWLTLTKKLAEEAPSDCPTQKEILETVFELFRKAIVQTAKERQ